MRLGQSGFPSTPKTWVKVPGDVESSRPKDLLQTPKAKVVIYTALFGDDDLLWSVPPIVALEAKYIVFTEKARREVGLWTHSFSHDCPVVIPGTGDVTSLSRVWEQRIVKSSYGPRKTARYYKAMAHKVLRGVDVSIWIDANVRLLLPPEEAVRRWVGKGSLATFNHPDRRCLFQEASMCLRQRKGDSRQIAAQVKAYRKAEMPREWGLAETRCVIRRHTRRIADLNELWWSQTQKYSVRDQIGFPFVCWKLGVPWGVIPGNAKRHKEFWFIYHKSLGGDRR